MKLYERSQEKAPLSIRYQLIEGTAVSSKTRQHIVYPENGTTFSPTGTSKIQLVLPGIEFLDTSLSYLKLKHTVTASANPQLSSSIHDIFRRVTIFTHTDGSVIEDINQANLLSRVISDYSLSEEARGKGRGYLEGYGSQSDLRTQAAGTTYCFKFMSGFLAQDKQIPLAITGPIRIELELANPSEAHYAGTGSPSYNVTDVQFIATMVSYENHIVAELFKQAREVCLPIEYQTFAHTVETSSAARDTFVIRPGKYKSIRGILLVPRLTSTLNKDDADSFLRTYPTGLESIEVTIDGRLHSRIECGTRNSHAYQETVKFFGQTNGLVTRTNYPGNMFAIGVETERHPDSLGLNSAISPQEIRVDYVSSNASQIQWDMYLEVNAVFCVGVGHNVVKV